MEKKNVSIKQVINQSLSHFNGHWHKALLSSLLQFGVFLIVFVLTNSILLSAISWAIFLPTQTAFLINIADENVHIENVFKLGRNYLTYILLAIVTILCYILGFIIAIIPAIILFINFAFVFELANKTDSDVLGVFKKSHNIAKGYKSNILWLGLIYLFIFLILVAFAVLIAMLVGLCLNTNSYLIYVWGTFVGVALYLILVTPVQILSMSNLKNAILKDKELNYVKCEQTSDDNEIVKTTETDDIVENIEELDDNNDLTDLIV